VGSEKEAAADHKSFVSPVRQTKKSGEKDCARILHDFYKKHPDAAVALASLLIEPAMSYDLKAFSTRSTLHRGAAPKKSVFVFMNPPCYETPNKIK
jgi:hypothetical protein